MVSVLYRTCLASVSSAPASAWRSFSPPVLRQQARSPDCRSTPSFCRSMRSWRRFCQKQSGSGHWHAAETMVHFIQSCSNLPVDRPPVFDRQSWWGGLLNLGLPAASSAWSALHKQTEAHTQWATIEVSRHLHDQSGAFQLHNPPCVLAFSSAPHCSSLACRLPCSVWVMRRWERRSPWLSPCGLAFGTDSSPFSSRAADRFSIIWSRS